MSDITVTVENVVAAVTVENLAGGPVVEVDAPGDLVTVVISNTGMQGPPGPAGSTARQAEAAAAVSGHRAMVELDDGHVMHADAGLAIHAHRVVGVSSNAASQGGTVTVVEQGRMHDSTFNLTPGLPVFVGLDGALVQIPGPGFIVQIGVATAPDVLQVRISRPIIRS